MVAAGYSILSATDTEVVAHLVHYYLQETENLRSAVEQDHHRLEGAYALGVSVRTIPRLLSLPAVAVR